MTESGWSGRKESVRQRPKEEVGLKAGEDGYFRPRGQCEQSGWALVTCLCPPAQCFSTGTTSRAGYPHTPARSRLCAGRLPKAEP